jgi:hypothetical protein
MIKFGIINVKCFFIFFSQLLNTTATMPSQNQQQSHTNNDVPEVVLRNTNSIISQYEELSREQEERFVTSQEEEVDVDDDDELQSIAPTLKRFMDSTNDDRLLISMTNFNFQEIIEIWEVVKPNLLRRRHRGRKQKYSPLDSLFLILIFVKHKPTMELFGHEYGLDKSVVERMFDTVVDECGEPLLNAFIPNLTKEELEEFEISCNCFRATKLIVDVRFHPTNRPTGRFSDVKQYFSGKHKDYGIKVETAHYPDGRIASISTHYPGSTHDFTIFKGRIEVYKKLLKKTSEEKNMNDEDPVCDIYPEEWLLIADSAYTGSSKYLRAKTVEHAEKHKQTIIKRQGCV